MRTESRINEKILRHLLIASSAALLSSSALAGTSSKGLGETNESLMKEPSASLFDEVGVTLWAGYDTAYYAEGTNIGDESVYTGLALSIPAGENFSLELEALFFSSPGNNFDDELNLTAGIGYEYGNLSIGVGNTFITTFGESTNQPGAGIGYDFGLFEFEIGGFWDEASEGLYFETGISRGIEITPWLTITPAVYLSYSDDYYEEGVSGLGHVSPQISADIALTETATLSPFIAGNIVVDALEDVGEEDNLYGGIALSVTF